ncbi:MAG TPA: methylmalonyl Co-A mutase-associated GTPase MeaB [Geminicoccaceae bacterium]
MSEPPPVGGRPAAGRAPLSADALVAGILARDRTLLSRAITLVESTRPDHRDVAQEVLAAVLPRTGGAHRVGVTGVPGVGKSTFIDAFGTMLTAAGRRVAVLAVDPSSSRTGGAILGDKTRMARLATDPAAFVRPSPTSGALGGVARMTREAMHLCEAAGYDVVLVETVGVGQSETAVADMVDLFLVLALPGAGDELQGIKKGLIELADLIAVNKAEGDNRLRAQQAARHYENALHIVEPASPSWRPVVLTMSALTGEGLDRLWATIRQHRERLDAAGELAAKRRGQQVRWMWSTLQDRLLDALRAHPGVRDLLPALEAEVVEGLTPPGAAAERLLAAFGRGGGRP